ncbi:ORF6C domain-containing protein [Paenibacillus sp. EKM205P]|uniref:ORF6C domain-containing protein n=1 Tax=Paenibacillus sp. EKM205P TaxID=1683673 RepID=UPI0013EBD11A|nr:ORF6C domain-containing protein [Paenibacillus sp. EKM205P]KAF6591025.1 ORF6C domain-containing protein [Paenibacillus sp. EKM205P]
MSNIQPIEQKMVPFNGTELLGVKANDGKVYIGVSYVCNGIGLSEKQKDRQVSNIQEDATLKQGAKKLPLKFGGQLREVLGIELDYLPLWLAKISITPNMQVNQPEVAEKLVQYQLKAKDVLAEAFIPKGFDFDSLSPELKAIFITDAKVQQLDSRVEHLENHTTIDYGQQRELRKTGNSRIVGLLGGKKSAAYKNSSLRNKTYQAMWNDYQDFFGINSYSNTFTKDFDRGLQYVPHWTPPNNLMREIEEANGQTLF